MAWLHFDVAEKANGQIRKGKPVRSKADERPVRSQYRLKEWISEELIQYFLCVLESIPLKSRELPG